MTIQLTRATFVDGSLAAAGSQHTLDSATEGYFVSQGIATWVGGAPYAGGGQAPASFALDTSGNVTGLMGPDGSESYQVGTGLTRDGIVRLSALGDSISNRDSAAAWYSGGLNGPLISGLGYTTQMVSNGAVRLIAGWAVAGYTTADLYTVVQSNGKTLLQSAIDDASTVVAVEIGTNDCYGPTTPDAASVIFARLRDNIWTPIRQAGKKVLAHTIPPRAPSVAATALHRAAVAQVNELIRAYCYANKIMLVDLAALWRSADGANQGTRIALLLNESGSYVHQNESGGMVVGMERWRVLKAAGASELPTDWLGLSSPYSIGANPHGVGSNATTVNRTVLGTGISGTGPHGWNITRTGTSTATIDPTAVARDDGRDGQSVRATISIVGAGEQVKILPAYNGNLFLAGGSTGTNLRGNTTLYAPGQVKQFSDGHWYKTVALGTTGAAEPVTLPSSIGGIVSDGTQVWVRLPDLTPGSTWMRGVAEVVVSSHSGANFAPYMYVKQYASGYAGLSAGATFEDNDGAQTFVTTAAGTVFGGALPGNNGYAPGYLPLNRKLRLVTPWVQIASDCAIIEPALSFIGGAGAEAVVLVNHVDVQVRA